MMKKVLEFMLHNRFGRLATAVLMFVLVLVTTSALEILALNYDWTWHIPGGALYLTPIVTFAVCLVGQLLGDILNVDAFFNGSFFTLLKRVAFFVVSLIVIVVGTGIVIAGESLETLLAANASAFSLGLCAACMYGPAFAFTAYVFGYISYSNHSHAKSEKKWLPFLFPISYAAAILVGFILSFALRMAGLDADTITTILPLATLVPIAIAVLACFKTGTWPFEEEIPYDSSYSGGYSGSTDNTPAPDENKYRGVKCCKYCRYHQQQLLQGGRLSTICVLCGVPTGDYQSCDSFNP